MLRKAESAARGRGIKPPAPAARLIGMGQAGEGFVEIRRAGGGRAKGVRDDVIAQARAKRAGIAEEIDLDRRGAQGQDRRARVPRESFQVYEDVDAVAVNRLRGLRVGKRANVSEMVESPHKPGAHRLAVIRAIGISVGFETRAVMRFEHFDQEQRRRVVVKIIR